MVCVGIVLSLLENLRKTGVEPITLVVGLELEGRRSVHVEFLIMGR